MTMKNHFSFAKLIPVTLLPIWLALLAFPAPLSGGDRSDVDAVDGLGGTAPANLVNISTRMQVGTGSNVMIGGFIITGTANKDVAVRGIGPTLGGFGVTGFLVDPTLELHNSSGATLMVNDDWQDNPAQAALLSAAGLALQNPKESGIAATLAPGAYTAIVAGKNGTSGVGLVEVYDTNHAADSQLANISTRGFVDTGENVMIGGFILGNGSGSGRVLIRAIGPSLSMIVPGALADPTLELHDNNGGIIATNDDWKSTQQAEIEATGIPPTDDRESAILQTLAPGGFTAIVRGKNNTTGVAVVEAYRLGGVPTPTPTPAPTATPGATPEGFVNLSSREMVGTGDAITVNAFIVTGSAAKQVLVRGLGPSLTAAGIPNVLADPTLELRSTGGVIASNDNWRDTQQAAIIATGLAPTNDLESAILATLNPGSYTSVLRGKNGTTGNALNELYDLSPSSSALTAVGTRAGVGSSEVLVSGIIIVVGGDALVRVLGPSLSSAGVSGTLQDPTLQLFNSQGTTIASNDNWRSTQQAAIIQTGLAPSDDREAALIATLGPGSFTAIASGVSSTIGIGYVQFYTLPHSGPALPLTP